MLAFRRYRSEACVTRSMARSMAVSATPSSARFPVSDACWKRRETNLVVSAPSTGPSRNAPSPNRERSSSIRSSSIWKSVARCIFPWPLRVARSPRLGEVGKVVEKFLVVLQRIRRGFGLDRRPVPQLLIVQEIDVILSALEYRPPVEEQREETGRYLILEAPPERPCARRVHVDGTDIRDEDLERASQRDVQPLLVPRLIGHGELLEERLLDPRECRDGAVVCPVNRH